MRGHLKENVCFVFSIWVLFLKWKMFIYSPRQVLWYLVSFGRNLNLCGLPMSLVNFNGNGETSKAVEMLKPLKQTHNVGPVLFNCIFIICRLLLKWTNKDGHFCSVSVLFCP